MYFRTFLSGLFLLTVAGACSSTDSTVSESFADNQPDERISLNINEAVYFEFLKFDSDWTGNLTVYTLNSDREKVVQSKYVADQDSTWNDFDLFVDFLNIYEISPQHEIDGWVPDSGVLPKRVYSFEVFDGDTTRSFSYQDPMNDIRDFWQPQNVLTFVTFVRNDLGWREKENIE